MTDQERAREWLNRTHRQIKDKILWIAKPSFKGIRVSDLLAAYADSEYQRGLEEGERRGMPKWISVEERLPEIACKVLMVAQYAGGKVLLMKLAERQWLNKSMRGWNWYGDPWWIDRERVSHWMPLPEPPAADAIRREGK